MFCDEINLPDMDAYGTQRVISFLRQLVEYNGFYRVTDQACILDCLFQWNANLGLPSNFTHPYPVAMECLVYVRILGVGDSHSIVSQDV